MRQGKGLFSNQNGLIYEGMFYNGKFHGKGKIKYGNGATYNG
jgi:hypothetical protein